jgi:hypothetical protein
MTTGAVEMFHSSRKLTVQSIFGGNKKSWFEVTDKTEDVVESDSSSVHFMTDFHGASGLKHISEDASFMNVFLATLRFDSVLQEHSLSIADSWDMVRRSIVDDQLSDPFLKQCITKYFALMCVLFLDVVENRTGDVGLVGIYIACASIVGSRRRSYCASRKPAK